MRILLVRLREIGDVVFTTPAIRAVRRIFPEARISYLVEPHAEPIVRHNPHIDEVIVAARGRGVRGALDDVALGLRLRRARYDIAIDFHGGPRAALLTWLSGAGRRIGYAIAGRQWMYTDRVARPRELRPRHSVRNQWDLLAPLNAPGPDPAVDGVEMAVSEDARVEVERRLTEAGVLPGEPIVILHVSAGNPFRRWPLDHFALVASSLAAQPGRRIVITSGPADRGAAERVVATARAALGAEGADRVLRCGDFSLLELRALLDRASVFIGGDSGPLHVAATTGVTVIGLYGPTLPARSAPWRATSFRSIAIDAGELPCRPCDQRVCTPGDFRCLTSIAPERVVDAALECLQ
jgi:lipopolysaccharide heptosyltransferase II